MSQQRRFGVCLRKNKAHTHYSHTGAVSPLYFVEITKLIFLETSNLQQQDPIVCNIRIWKSNLNWIDLISSKIQKKDNPISKRLTC